MIGGRFRAEHDGERLALEAEGGIGANAELLDAVRTRVADLLPYPPHVQISSLGDGAVLMGGLSVGVRSALESVFAARRAWKLSHNFIV